MRSKRKKNQRELEGNKLIDGLEISGNFYDKNENRILTLLMKGMIVYLVSAGMIGGAIAGLKGLDVKEFQYMYYNPWDAQFITYLTVSYDEAAYADEMERLSNIGVEDYTQYYNVTGEPSGYDICAMDSDEYYGFVYAIIPENSESKEITYVGIWFCNYFLDVDVHDYMKDEYLLEGFDASNDNPYRKDRIKDLEDLAK